MATTQSTEKILNFLEKQNNPITKTEITVGCALPSASVTQILDLLVRLKQIEIWTNGKTELIKIKLGDKNGATN